MAGAVEYAVCISAEYKNSHSNECLGYDTKLQLMVGLQSRSSRECGLPSITIDAMW